MSAESRREALKALLTAPGIALAAPPILCSPAPYFELAGEEFGARMILTSASNGADFCLRPDFTLPIAVEHLRTGAATPAAYGYLGPIFRHRADGPAEFDQAGLELLAMPDAASALDNVAQFARSALDLYGVENTSLRIGSIDLFEALLAASEMPDVWRPRIRARFGHAEALNRLLDRLSDPHAPLDAPRGMPESDIAEWVRELMLTSGLSPNEGRSPEEIAQRYLEKQALEAAHVPAETIALLRAYLAISGEAGTALADIAALARNAAINLTEPLSNAADRIAQLARTLDARETVFDAAFSPRLDYYTGVTFEVTAASGAVLASGGQYDRLLKRLGAPSDIPAVGCAVWVERLEAEGAK